VNGNLTSYLAYTSCKGLNCKYEVFVEKRKYLLLSSLYFPLPLLFSPVNFSSIQSFVLRLFTFPVILDKHTPITSPPPLVIEI
jgi:hypothetical protein